MHLNVQLPSVQPDTIQLPSRCPYPDRRHRKQACPGTRFKLHQVHCPKPVRAQRYRCLSCRRTFRVYPSGVTSAQQSATLKALSVLLYILGLSYQGVVDLLEALNQPMCKSTVYNNVQAAGEQAIHLRSRWLKQQGASVQVLGIDCTHVKRVL